VAPRVIAAESTTNRVTSNRAPVGIYNNIIMRACVDGIFSTFRSCTKQVARNKAYRRVMDKATEELIGSAD
jgi:hypothetical protein